MKKTLIISEADNIAALLENDRVVEFFVNRGELLLGDVYTATVENILPGIDAAFVNLGKDKMGFLHANDVPGSGNLKEKLVPKQKLLVQITKEPTGHKGPRVSTAVSLPGRFLVLVPEERGVSISRRIAEAKERARLKAIVNLMKPPGVGIIIRTEAKGQGEQELFEDFELLWDRWQTIVSDGEASIGPMLIYRDQDLLFRVIRDAYSNDVAEIIVDTAEGQKRALDYMQGWASRNTKVLAHMGEEPLLIAKGVDKEIEAALSDRAELPSGGHLNVQPTEALTVIDVNSGRFTSSRTQAETVRRTNLEAAQEIPRQLRLRNIGGMVIVDFIDMDSRRDQQQVLEQFQRALEDDRAKPQIGQLSDLGLVELTRRRQGQSLRELFTTACQGCHGLGVTPTLELGFGDFRRVLSFKPKDDDLRGRRGQRGRQQQSALKAVTAGGGRIRQIVEEEAPEEEAHDVPEDILQQVPDEILEHQHAFGKSAHLNLEENEDDEDRDRDAHFGEEQRESAFTRAPLYREPTGRFEAEEADDEDDEEDDDEDEETVEIFEASEVEEAEEEVEQEAMEEAREQFAHTASRAGSDEPAYFASEPEIEEAEAIEEVPELKMPESQYETEVDPVTGIFRLKARPNNASMTSALDAGTAGTAMATAEPGRSAEQIIENAVHKAADWKHHQPEETAGTVELSETAHQELVWQSPDNETHNHEHEHEHGHDRDREHD
ncbi:MAG TPA: Rne/Rng family ribonuclease [Candidatus Obscuribacterales bacterium]